MSPKKGRKPRVVDTNVLIVANRRNNESLHCASNCAQALLLIKNSGTLVIDTDREILTEYLSHCALRVQPGVGDSFVKWVYDNVGRADLVEAIEITRKQNDDRRLFEQFPDHQDLRAFDRADQKFVAVSCAHPESPSILQATDSKWINFEAGFRACNITVEFLCEAELREVHARKSARKGR